MSLFTCIKKDVQGKKVDTDKEKRDTGMMEFELAFYQGIIRYIHAGYSWILKVKMVTLHINRYGLRA